MMIINKKNNSGYALLELLFYISFFAVLSLVVIDAMVVMAKSFKETSIQAEFVQSGSIMERMSREIRQASSVDATSTNTDLKLMDSSGAIKTEFKFINPNLELWENSSKTGNLNTSNISITALTFTQITTVKGKAVRIFFTLKSNNDMTNRTIDFQDTIVLRGSY